MRLAQWVSGDRSSDVITLMKLRPSTYLVLGMVRLGAKSGYAIKKATDISTHVFFSTSLAQVYPELARLHSAGLTTRHDDPHGGRSRLAYAITERGEEALRSWLRSSARSGPTLFRDENLMRLFFADALPPEEQLMLVRRIRDQAREAQQWMETEVIPAAQAIENRGYRHPHTVARLGADTYRFMADWYERLEADLRLSRPASE
jgi:DNA-binding PadR family transcriptional regulator